MSRKKDNTKKTDKTEKDTVKRAEKKARPLSLEEQALVSVLATSNSVGIGIHSV